MWYSRSLSETDASVRRGCSVADPPDDPVASEALEEFSERMAGLNDCALALEPEHLPRLDSQMGASGNCSAHQTP